MYAYKTKLVDNSVKAKPTQVLNNTGGYVFQTSDMQRLTRFLVLGTTASSFYASSEKVVDGNAAHIEKLISGGYGVSVVDEIVRVSDAGLSVNNDFALFALAICLVSKDAFTQSAAADAINRVARIGTHKVHLAQFLKNMGGFNIKSVRKAMASAYNGLSLGKLEYDLIKYRNRDGWTQGDVLRLSHPRPNSPLHAAAFYFAVHGFDAPVEPKFDSRTSSIKAQVANSARYENFLRNKNHLKKLAAYDSLQQTTDPATAAKLIQDFELPRECVPTELLNSPLVWEALLPHMGMSAMIRNLAKMTTIGLLDGANLRHVIGALTDAERIQNERVHPINILLANNIYAQGHGQLGDNTWKPVQLILNALNEAMYLSFDAIEPTGKRLEAALDVSGSMSMSQITKETPKGQVRLPLTPRDVCAVFAMILRRRESNCAVHGFSDRYIDLKIKPTMRLEEVVAYMWSIPYGGTNLSLAYDVNEQVDGFMVMTDDEVNQGPHPYQKLKQYRQKYGPAKSVIAATTATPFSIADPDDMNSLDVAGFSPDLLSTISKFVVGEF